MKRIKVILGIIAVLAIITVTALNVNFKLQNEKLSALSLANIEMLAYGEDDYNDYYDNHWTDWIDQGFTKDEYVKNVKCTKTTGVCIDLWIFSYDNKTTYEGHKDICCEPGYANCTPTDCQ